jgi:uncharacterized protein (DUF433 family)
MQLPDFLMQYTADAIRLTGHRIGLEHVIPLYNEGYSAEMLHEEYPSLPLALIHKVIAFYLENRMEVDEYLQRSEETAAQHEAAHPPSPALLRARDALAEKKRRARPA